jgi:hypothetical protein
MLDHDPECFRHDLLLLFRRVLHELLNEPAVCPVFLFEDPVAFPAQGEVVFPLVQGGPGPGDQVIVQESRDRCVCRWFRDTGLRCESGEGDILVAPDTLQVKKLADGDIRGTGLCGSGPVRFDEHMVVALDKLQEQVPEFHDNRNEPGQALS